MILPLHLSNVSRINICKFCFGISIGGGIVGIGRKAGDGATVTGVAGSAAARLDSIFVPSLLGADDRGAASGGCFLFFVALPALDFGVVFIVVAKRRVDGTLSIVEVVWMDGNY